MIRSLALLIALIPLVGCSPVIVRDGPWAAPPLRHEEIDAGLEGHVHLVLPNRAVAVADTWSSWSSGSPLLAQAMAEALRGSAQLQVEATLDAPHNWFPDRPELSGLPPCVGGGLRPPGGSAAAPRPSARTAPACSTAGDARVLSPVERVRLHAAASATPYTILCREQFEHDEGWTPLRVLYLGLVTILFVPGEMLETHATLEAALLDVHTGVTVARATVREEETSNFVRVGRTPAVRRDHERAIAERGARALAARLEQAISRHLEAHRYCPPGMATLPPSAAGAAGGRGGFFEERDHP